MSKDTSLKHIFNSNCVIYNTIMQNLSLRLVQKQNCLNSVFYVFFLHTLDVTNC